MNWRLLRERTDIDIAWLETKLLNAINKIVTVHRYEGDYEGVGKDEFAKLLVEVLEKKR